MQLLYVFALCLLIWLMTTKMFIVVIMFVWDFLRWFLWELILFKIIVSMKRDRESIFKFVSIFF